MPKYYGGSNDANQNITKVPASFLSSFSQKIDVNKYVGDASTSNTMDNTKRDTAHHPKTDLQRRPIQLEGYRKIFFDGILGFPNAIPQEMRKRLPKFVGNNANTWMTI